VIYDIIQASKFGTIKNKLNYAYKIFVKIMFSALCNLELFIKLTCVLPTSIYICIKIVPNIYEKTHK
jgi:hypothetical protein